jgi:hypothetical protein
MPLCLSAVRFAVRWAPNTLSPSMGWRKASRIRPPPPRLPIALANFVRLAPPLCFWRKAEAVSSGGLDENPPLHARGSARANVDGCARHRREIGDEIGGAIIRRLMRAAVRRALSKIKEGPASAALRLVVLRRTTNAGSSLPQFRAILRR